ncbi:hypothetical protein GRF29_19g626999 [Pseudopithomyces chartarum]|uniref:Glycoside hydrolase family 93 protein n=1 Tax=Pseudopithomyces chartarum TaxID=1892770 RepID=A0AAN6M5I0_9PLEO|nr:hypothetical protein GRF29_19g626999 [Pseudopithomyces chartarum]
MRLYEFLLSGIVFLSPVLAQEDEEPEPPPPTPTGIDSFANVTLYQPDDPKTQLTAPRSASLPNNTVLAVWNDPSNNGSISIYRSTNSGFSWYAHSTVTSDSRKKLSQPNLLYINETSDGESGTVLLTAVAANDKTTTIELYSSGDQGATWDIVSEIASGGPLSNVTSAVANPSLLQNGDDITVFYAGKGDRTHAQKIVQQTTGGDYDSWGNAADVVASQSQTDRPSAPSVAKISKNQYIVAFQNGVLDTATNNYTYPIYYKITTNLRNAAKDRTREFRVDTGAVPSGSPSVTWSPLGGSNGTIVLSDSKSGSVFVNQALGEGEWWELPTTAGRALGREVAIPANDQTKLRFVGGTDPLGKGASQVLVTVMNLKKAIGA